MGEYLSDLRKLQRLLERQQWQMISHIDGDGITYPERAARNAAICRELRAMIKDIEP